MLVRRAQAADEPAIIDLARRYADADHHDFDERHVETALRPLLDSDVFGVVLIAASDDEVHGYAVLTWGYGLESGGIEALLDEIYVEPRGRGIGAQLVTAVLEAATAHGARTIFLETESHNGAARSFYRAHGFTVEDSIWMRRELSP